MSDNDLPLLTDGGWSEQRLQGSCEECGRAIPEASETCSDCITGGRENKTFAEFGSDDSGE